MARPQYLAGAEHLVGNPVPARQLRPPPLSDDLHAHSLRLDGGRLSDVSVADHTQGGAQNLVQKSLCCVSRMRSYTYLVVERLGVGRWPNGCQYCLAGVYNRGGAHEREFLDFSTMPASIAYRLRGRAASPTSPAWPIVYAHAQYGKGVSRKSLMVVAVARPVILSH